MKTICRPLFNAIHPHKDGRATYQSVGCSFGLRKNMSDNPRWKSTSFRKKIRARFKAMDLPCHICGKPIRYDVPSCPSEPLSLVVDEVIPISRWKEFGYQSPEAVALDKDNLKPAHYKCNAIKSNHLPGDKVRVEKKLFIPDGEW